MKNQDTYVFPCVFTYEDGQISITFPDLLGCVSCADTEQEAIKNAKEALGGHLWCMEKDHDPIPTASALMGVALEENETASLVEVFMPSIRLAQETKSISRTVTLPAWLNAQALEKGINFSQVLQSALMERLGSVQAR